MIVKVRVFCVAHRLALSHLKLSTADCREAGLRSLSLFQPRQAPPLLPSKAADHANAILTGLRLVAPAARAQSDFYFAMEVKD